MEKDKVGRPDIDSYEAMMMREDRQKGFHVSFDYTSDEMMEIGNFTRSPTAKSAGASSCTSILPERTASPS